MSDFTNQQVKEVSEFIQSYMQENNIALMTADECAELLAKNKLLMNTVGPKPGFNFRQMLRDGRDGHINVVAGACQETPRAKWYIYSLSANNKEKNKNAELVAELTYLFDNELVSKGKKQLSLKAANEILKSEEGFSDIDLKSLLESGNFPQAYQTEHKPKQWYIGFSKPDKYKERRTEFLKNSSQVETQILPNNTTIDNTQYKVWIIVIVIVVIAGIYKLSTTPSIQNSSNLWKIKTIILLLSVS